MNLTQINQPCDIRTGQLSLSPSFDVKATPFGEYDARFICTVASLKKHRVSCPVCEQSK